MQHFLAPVGLCAHHQTPPAPNCNCKNSSRKQAGTPAPSGVKERVQKMPQKPFDCFCAEMLLWCGNWKALLPVLLFLHFSAWFVVIFSLTSQWWIDYEYLCRYHRQKLNGIPQRCLLILFKAPLSLTGNNMSQISLKSAAAKCIFCGGTTT